MLRNEGRQMARRNKNQEATSGGAGENLATIGERFRAAREKQGWEIEDVSRMLRLRPTILREIENDDLGSFTHASYARLSLLGYARLLGIPEEEVRAWLPAKGDLSSGEFTYLDRLQNPEPAARREDFAEQRLPKRSPLETLLKVTAVVVLLLGAVYAYIIWHNLGRLQGGGTEAPAEVTQPVIPFPPPVIVLESAGETITETPFQLTPQDSPTPFIEQDALALELQIPLAASPVLDENADPEMGASSEAGVEFEVRAALPVEASPADAPAPESATTNP
jgi:cytoskeletal protein RodZ